MSSTTIYTLAEELNMTPSMVSRAFNPSAKVDEEKRRIILEAAAKRGFSPNRLASRLSMKSVNIGVLINSRFKVNTDKMLAGIDDAYAGLKDYKVKYDVTVLNPETDDFDSVRRAVDKYKSYDGVILTGMSASDYTGLIDELYEVNRNVVQVQAINRDAKHLFASKHDERVASELAAEFLYNSLRYSGRKNVLLFTGDLKTTLHTSAAEAFDHSCSRLGLNLLSTVDMKDNEEELSRIIPEVFGMYAGATDAIFITSGLSAPLCRYIDEHELNIPFITFDTYGEIKEYMKKGVISATISQNVAHQMRIAFELLVKHLIMGEDCPRTVYTDVQLVLASNIHQFD